MSGDLTERARQLSAEAEHLHSVTKRRKETEVAARKQALAVTGEAASPDGSVRVTADAGGMPTDLVLKPGATDANDLAQLVLQVAQQAAARAREAVRAVYEPLEAEGIVRGMPVLLPEPAPTHEPPARPPARADEDASYEERPVMRRSRRP